MKKLIFVCTGNTCRSPMAEVLAKFFCKNSYIDISSRGLFANQNKASKNAMNAVLKYNLSLEDHISKPFTKEDIEESYLILTMTNGHKDLILSNFPIHHKKVFTLYEYILSEDKNINDPFGGDLKTYLDCLDELHYLISKIDFDNI